MKNTVILAVGAVAATISLSLTITGCAKYTEPFKDAERGSTNDSPADLITMPDGFSDAATKCDNGNRIYTLYHGDSAYGAIAVVPDDPTC